MIPQPPKLAERIIQWLVKTELAEEILGDLEEKFLAVSSKKSLRRAQLNYWYQVLNYCRPFAIGHHISGSKTQTMLTHNLKVTFRNFGRYRSQFVINLTGLTTAMTCLFLIHLWISDEQAIDKFHHNGNRLYHVMSNQTDASGTFTWKGTPGLLMDELETIPEIEQSAVSTDVHEYTLVADDISLKADGRFASDEYFDLFNYPLAFGTLDHSAGKSAVFISRDLATKLFGKEDAIGERLEWKYWTNSKTFEVVGVLDNVPSTTSEPFDFVIPWDYFHDDLIQYKNWYNYYARIHVRLREGAETSTVDQKLTDILQEKQKGDDVSLFLANFGDLYLFNLYENGEQAGGRIEYVRVFQWISLFILLIAAINFVNLTTAKASHRLKEVGVRKTLGASRPSLIGQYLTESFLLVFSSMILAVILVVVLLPQFNFIADKSISLSIDITTLGYMLGLGALLAVTAGIYPAVFLSGFGPVAILKGQVKRSVGEAWSRRGLVVVQFALSVIMMVAVAVVYSQMEYVQDQQLGYNRDNIIYFEREGAILDNTDGMMGAIQNIAGVEEVSSSGFMIGGGNSTGGVSWPGKEDKDQLQFWEIRSGNGMIEMLDIEVISGRAFSEDYGLDTAAVIFNETAIKAMGLENPLGTTIRHYTGEKRIVGVVKDFHLQSLHHSIEPMIFLYEPDRTHFIMAKISDQGQSDVIQKMGSVYENFNPGYPFNPIFLDQDLQAQYASEQRISQLIGYFALFAILISCLGLFGLASFVAERRAKEVGIRKILGSSLSRIVMMLTRDFTTMVLIAVIIATPIAYLLMENWLQNYAYAISLDPVYFVVAALVAFVVAWATVGMQTWRVARSNPVDTLRDE